MATWSEFSTAAPRISAIFARRHTATGNLCLMATLRADGSPRISPIEPAVFEGQLWITGMPGTVKFADLDRDPRLCLHTATVDPQVGDGDAKLWGVVRRELDPAVHERFTADLFERTRFDLRGQQLDRLFATDLTGASSVELTDGHLEITIWRPGELERVVRKH